MSGENLELVRSVVDAFQDALKREDPGAVFDCPSLAPDSEWWPAADLVGPESYRGREGFVAFWKTWTEDFEGMSIEPERFFAAGDDRVVMVARQYATGKASGVTTEMHFASVYELEDGKVIRIRNYLDVDKAFAAAGISP